MATTRRSNLSAKCPVCSGAEINVSENPETIAGRLFQCASCGTYLKPALSRRMLWAIPVFLCSTAAFLAALIFLKQAPLSGFLQAGAQGALGALFFAVNMGIFLRRFEYRIVAKPPQSP